MAKSQIEKFRETARTLETNEDEASFNSTLQTIVRAKGEARAVAHASDCAVHDAPAYKAGACTCGASKAEQ